LIRGGIGLFARGDIVVIEGLVLMVERAGEVGCLDDGGLDVSEAALTLSPPKLNLEIIL
jgi:hypothetical protein